MTGSSFFFSAVSVAAGSASDPYPVILSSTPTSFVTNTTSHLVSMPAVVNAGDLLLVTWGNDRDATITVSGFTQKYWKNYTTNMSTAIFAKIAIGNEGGTTVDFVTSGVEQAGAIVHRITNWGGSIADDIVTSTAVEISSTSAPNPPTLTSGFGAVPTLWIASVVFSAATTVNSVSSGYDPLGTAGNNTGTADCMVVPCAKLSSAASEDPGAYAYSVAAGATSLTVAVRGTA